MFGAAVPSASSGARSETSQNASHGDSASSRATPSHAFAHTTVDAHHGHDVPEGSTSRATRTPPTLAPAAWREPSLHAADGDEALRFATMNVTEHGRRPARAFDGPPRTPEDGVPHPRFRRGRRPWGRPVPVESTETRTPPSRAERASAADASFARASLQQTPAARSEALARPAASRAAAHATAPAVAPRPVPAKPANGAASEGEQIVRVSIGRIRVEAPAAPAAPSRPVFARPRPRLSIDEYARRRGGAP